MTDCIAIQNLEMHFKGCDALRGIDLTVPCGSVFALLGENGAGKTTLIRILTGFQRPSNGTCSVLGLNPATDSLEIRRRVGYVSDAPALYDWMQVDEIGWFASSFYPSNYLDSFRELIARFEVPATRKIRHLSKGQRAKVALALAIAHDPELLILDEPTSGLDPLVRREFLESMVERAATGRTVLLSSHQISEVERVADQVAILHEGKVQLNATLGDLRENVCEVTFGVDDPLAAIPVLNGSAEVLSHQQKGRQVRLVVRGFDDRDHESVGGWPGVHSLRKRPATLDEIFVACTRGISPSPAEADAMLGTFHDRVDSADRQAS
ncbi:MAG: ABC transporter ATP-binding protein [Pirellula sp.]